MFPNMHSPDAEYHISYNQLFKGFLCFYLKNIRHQQLQMRTFVFKIQYIDNIPSLGLLRNEVYISIEKAERL